jgi:hypothetical protein
MISSCVPETPERAFLATRSAEEIRAAGQK